MFSFAFQHRRTVTVACQMRMELGRVGIWTAHLDIAADRRRSPELAAELEDARLRRALAPRGGRPRSARERGAAARRDRAARASPPASPTSTAATRSRWRAVWKTLTEAFPDRFLLGLGVSHQPAVEGMRGTSTARRSPTMRDVPRRDGRARRTSRRRRAPSRVRALAALGPKMLALAAERAVGAHPYFVPVEHTAIARETLGPDAWLAARADGRARDRPDDGRARSPGGRWRSTSACRTT